MEDETNSVKTTEIKYGTKFTNFFFLELKKIAKICNDFTENSKNRNLLVNFEVKIILLNFN